MPDFVAAFALPDQRAASAAQQIAQRLVELWGHYQTVAGSASRSAVI